MAQKLPTAKLRFPFLVLFLLVLFVATSLFLLRTNSLNQFILNLPPAKNRIEDLNTQISALSSQIEALKAEDQRKTNDELKEKIRLAEQGYKEAITVYEMVSDYDDQGGRTQDLRVKLAAAFNHLINLRYDSAREQLTQVRSDLDKLKQADAAALAAAAAKAAAEAAAKAAKAGATIPANTAVSSTPPSAGYSRQSVPMGGTNYLVSIVAADYGSTRVIVDTASDSTCTNDCPVLPLADYVARNGAFAGINGSYFCPATYPSCAGKTNSFDLLLMNKNKTYFNSDNNVYSNNPGVVFGSGYIRWLGSVSQWGRDTGIDGMISNYPLLVSGGQAYAGAADQKEAAKGGRSFVASKGNTVYIGVVHAASIGEAALVLQAMGMENALNLDDGGSTALWSGGYKVGPGRNLPNVILFVGR